MKKTDLIEGTEYAVFMRPTRGRYGKLRSWDGKPLRATLVSTEGSVKMTQRMINHEGKEYDKETVTTGLLFELAEPKKVKRPTLKWAGTWSPRKPSVQRKLDAAKEVVHTIKLVALPNAGCVWSTWADWEASIAAEEQAKIDRANERKKRIEEETAAEPAILKQLGRLRKTFKAAFGKEWKDDEPWRGGKISYAYGDGGRYGSDIKIVAFKSDVSGKITGFKVSLPGDKMLDLLALEFGRGCSQ